MIRIAFNLLLIAGTSFPLLAQELPLPVSEIKRDEPIDFAREIMPVLKRNCLACHHANEAEGGLVLESAEQIREGGDSGSGADPEDIEASTVFVRAAGIEEPLMPPEDNSVGAKPLTPEELGLLKKWIEQGAKASESSDAEMIEWQPIPESIKTVYSLDISPDGRFAAVGRGNRVLVVDAANGNEIQRLVDRSLLVGEVADVDLIQSIATSPDGKRIATGGFRTVRIWKNVPQPAQLAQSPLMRAVGHAAVNSDSSRAAIVNAIGDVEIWNLADNQLQQTLLAHHDPIVDVAWAGDAGRVVSVDAAGYLNLWDGQDGQKAGGTKLSAVVKQMAVAPNGHDIALVDINGGLHVLAITDDAKLAPAANFTPEVSGATAVAWTGTDTPILHVASGNKVQSYSLPENKLLREVDHGAAVQSLAATHDGERLASGATDGSAKIWNVADGKLLATLQGDPQTSLHLADATQDAARQKAAIDRLNSRTAELEKLLAAEVEVVKKATEEQKKAKEAFDAEAKKHEEAVALVAATETKINKVDNQLKQAEQTIAASMQEMTSATSTADGLEKSIAEQKQKLSEAQTTVSEVQAKIDELAKARETAAAMVAAAEKAISEQDAALKAAREKAAMAEKQQQDAKAKAEQAKAAAEQAKKELEAQQKTAAAAEEAKQKSEQELTKRNQVLASAGAAKQRAEAAIPEHQTRIEEESRRHQRLVAKASQLQDRLTQPIYQVVSIAFNHDGSQLATGHANGSIRVFQADDGTPTHSFDSQISQPWSQVTFVDNTVVGFAPRSPAQSFGTASQWQLETTIGAIEDESIISDRVTALDFSGDSMTIAVGSGPPSRFGEVKIFAVHGGRLVRDFGQVHSDTVLSLAFSPTGRQIASSSADKTIRLLDVASGKLIRSLEGHTHHVLGVDWQDDGQTLASASADQSIKIWDTQTGEQRRTIGGFNKETTAVDFIRDTNQIVAACADGNVRLSDTSNGKTLRNFSAGGDFLFTVSVSPDGTQIMAGGQSGVVRSWNLADGKLLFELK